MHPSQRDGQETGEKPRRWTPVSNRRLPYASSGAKRSSTRRCASPQGAIRRGPAGFTNEAVEDPSRTRLEPADPCCLPALGELGRVPPREGLAPIVTGPSGYPARRRIRIVA